MALNGRRFEELGAPWHHNVPIVIPPQQLFLLPHALYGIAYDFYTRLIEDPLPDGWHMHRGE